jgi:aminodeoxyfutalosine deaminase
MIQYISANVVYPVSHAPIPNGVLGIANDGTIVEILTPKQAAAKQIVKLIKYNGVLVPGFINTHCHLELSHLLGKTALHTGLVNFLQNIITQRDASDEAILAAMQQADAAMLANGIVAVGDISNKICSKKIKENSKIYYHTFIEVVGFNPANAEKIFKNALQLKQDFEPLTTAIVPHAPYSVANKLFKAIANFTLTTPNKLSIHNQESEAENDFFKAKTGSFLNLYQFLGLAIPFFKAAGKTSIQSYLPKLPKNEAVLLVHNTFTNKADVLFAEKKHPNLYWCLCPNANLYIENALPNVALLQSQNVKITLGTDSLASNQQLNILAEMQILQQQKGIVFTDLLKWATLNGAEFLGIANKFGSFEVGKNPGINLIKLGSKEQITTTKIKKIR